MSSRAVVRKGSTGMAMKNATLALTRAGSLVLLSGVVPGLSQHR